MVTQINILTRTQCAKCDNPYMIVEPSAVVFEVMELLEEGAGLQAFDLIILDHTQILRCSNCAAVLDIPSEERVAEWKAALRAYGESLIERASVGQKVE